MNSERTRALLISGQGGAGKAAVAGAIGRVLTSGGHLTAVMDLDELSQFGPPPAAGSAFHNDLRARNLAALCTTFREAGARFIIVSGVVETKELRSKYTESLSDCDVQLVRLVVPADTRRQRIESRGRPNYGAKVDLAADIEDFTVCNDGLLETAAREILTHAGWPLT